MSSKKKNRNKNKNNKANTRQQPELWTNAKLSANKGVKRNDRAELHAINDLDKAKRTLVVEGFPPRKTTSNLLWELFVQGGPVQAVTLRNDHAFVLFHDEVSVGFCLALFSDLELFGNPVKIRPKYHKDPKVWQYKNTLKQIHEHLSDTFRDMPPPYLFEKKQNDDERIQKPDKKRKNKSRRSKSNVI